MALRQKFVLADRQQQPPGRSVIFFDRCQIRLDFGVLQWDQLVVCFKSTLQKRPQLHLAAGKVYPHKRSGKFRFQVFANIHPQAGIITGTGYTAFQQGCQHFFLLFKARFVHCYQRCQCGTIPIQTVDPYARQVAGSRHVIAQHILLACRQYLPPELRLGQRILSAIGAFQFAPVTIQLLYGVVQADWFNELQTAGFVGYAHILRFKCASGQTSPPDLLIKFFTTLRWAAFRRFDFVNFLHKPFGNGIGQRGPVQTEAH